MSAGRRILLSGIRSGGSAPLICPTFLLQVEQRGRSTRGVRRSVIGSLIHPVSQVGLPELLFGPAMAQCTILDTFRARAVGLAPSRWVSTAAAMLSDSPVQTTESGLRTPFSSVTVEW